MRRSVMRFVYSLASCLVMVSVLQCYLIFPASFPFFRQMARLLLKRFRCLAYMYRPGCHDSSLYLFVLVIFLEVVVAPSIRSLHHFLYQHIVHALVECCLQPSTSSMRCSSSYPFAYFHRIVLVASVVVHVVFLCIIICRSLPIPLLVELLSGLFVLLQPARCHTMVSRISLFVPRSYLVIGSLCLNCLSRSV